MNERLPTKSSVLKWRGLAKAVDSTGREVEVHFSPAQRYRHPADRQMQQAQPDNRAQQ